MYFIVWVIFGLVLGAVDRLLSPGLTVHGVFASMLLGVCGTLFGALLGQAVGLYGPGDPASFFMALFGAIVVLFIYRVAVAPKSSI